MSHTPQLLELVEYEAMPLHKSALDPALAQALWRQHGAKINVEAPSFHNDDQWVLTPQGWVGYIPLSSDLHLALRPKVPIANLFRMLEYAYRLGTFFRQDLVQVESLEELYERLALVLAQRVLDRARQGLYRDYISLDERTPFIRGRMELRHAATRPWDHNPHCHYHEHTADVRENRILAYTLFQIARTGICTEHSRATVHQALRCMGHVASLEPVSPQQCLDLLYHRLNEDYQPLHALCHFFLAHVGPGHRSGDQQMLPFLINMNQLFESFVAAWLQRASLPGYRFTDQEKLEWDATNGLRSSIDLVLWDDALGKPVAVLDTKYKRSVVPEPADVHQGVFYAQGLGCHEAVLVYPTLLEREIDTYVGDIRVRTLTFDLSGDLDAAGEAFLRELLGERIAG
jgi:5-methylcytosine-specific restriction enzyme subunit McrC